ncbi:hypothetical protein BdWA1_001087 [Babesia duncani]|uniref:Uncharacterized protein n=1 Tax=Babesia duncani TaxID=323732 RepID=A0AAD9PNH7_9APIC|nr:hypothetical protein BdWA1_001087 [Babesia duncani]
MTNLNTIFICISFTLSHVYGGDVGDISPTKSVPITPIVSNSSTANSQDGSTNTVEIKPQKPSGKLKGDVKAQIPPKAPEPNLATNATDATNENIVAKDTETAPLVEETLVNSLVTAVGRFLQSDFNFLIRCGAILTSLLTQLIPLYTIMSIKWNKTTGKQNCATFITVAFSNYLWSTYGILCWNLVIIFSSVPG